MSIYHEFNKNKRAGAYKLNIYIEIVIQSDQ